MIKTLEKSFVTCPWCQGDGIDPDAQNIPISIYISPKCWYCDGEGTVSLEIPEDKHDREKDT